MSERPHLSAVRHYAQLNPYDVAALVSARSDAFANAGDGWVEITDVSRLLPGGPIHVVAAGHLLVLVVDGVGYLVETRVP